jgi:nucleotide-binding universal stress UspA family protein
VEELALHYRSRVIFLQVIEANPPIGVAERAYSVLQEQELEQRTREAQSYLTSMQGKFREIGIDAQVRVAYGPVVEAIINVAKREDADLIAIASHGRSGLSQVFYGSVAAGVLHRIERPLLLIRSRDRE